MRPREALSRERDRGALLPLARAGGGGGAGRSAVNRSQRPALVRGTDVTFSSPFSCHSVPRLLLWKPGRPLLRPGLRGFGGREKQGEGQLRAGWSSRCRRCL